MSSSYDPRTGTVSLAEQSRRKIVLWGSLGIFLGVFIFALSVSLIIYDNMPMKLVSLMTEVRMVSIEQLVLMVLLAFVIFLPVIGFRYLRDGLALLETRNGAIFIRADNNGISFRHPVIATRLWYHVGYREMSLPYGSITGHRAKTGSDPLQYPPVFNLEIRQSNGRVTAIDCLYFRENIEVISGNIKRILDRGDRDISEVMLLGDEIAMLNGLDPSQSVCDDQGRYIPLEKINGKRRV